MARTVAALALALAAIGATTSAVSAACPADGLSCVAIDRATVVAGVLVRASAIQVRCDLAKPMAVDLVDGGRVAGSASLLDARYDADGTWSGWFRVPRLDHAAGPRTYGLALRCAGPRLEGGGEVTVQWAATLLVLSPPATDAASTSTVTRPADRSAPLPVLLAIAALGLTLATRRPGRRLTRRPDLPRSHA